MLKKKANPCKNQYNCLFRFLFLLQELIWWVSRAMDGDKGRSEMILVSGRFHQLSPSSLQGCRDHLQLGFPSPHRSFRANTTVVIVVGKLETSIDVS